MNAFMNSLFVLLLGWVRGLADQIWQMLTTDNKTFLEWLGEYWIPIAGGLLIFGILMDMLANRIRAQRNKPKKKKKKPAKDPAPVEDAPVRAPSDWLPEQPVLSAADERSALKQAESVSDAELGSYPGRRYEEPPMEETHKYGALSGTRPAEEAPKRRRRGQA